MMISMSVNKTEPNFVDYDKLFSCYVFVRNNIILYHRLAFQSSIECG